MSMFNHSALHCSQPSHTLILQLDFSPSSGNVSFFLLLWLMNGPQFVGRTRTVRSRLISTQEQWCSEAGTGPFISQSPKPSSGRCVRDRPITWPQDDVETPPTRLITLPFCRWVSTFDCIGMIQRTPLEWQIMTKQNEQSVKYPNFKRATFYFCTIYYFPSSPYVMTFDVYCCYYQVSWYFSSISLTLKLKSANDLYYSMTG